MTQHWSRDGGSVLVKDPSRRPIPIEWFNLATGQRTPFGSFDPGGLAMVTGAVVVVSDDERSRVISVSTWQDLLFTADVAR